MTDDASTREPGPAPDDEGRQDAEPAGEGGNAEAPPEERRDRQDVPYHGGT